MSRGKKKKKKKGVAELRCSECGAPLVPVDEWMRRFYWKMHDGELPAGKYDNEIEELVASGKIKAPKRRKGD